MLYKSIESQKPLSKNLMTNSQFHLTSGFNEVSEGNLGKMPAEHFSIKSLLIAPSRRSQNSGRTTSKFINDFGVVTYMDYIQVSQQDVVRCLNLFRYVGFSHLKQPTEQDFERHLTSNRKVLTIHGEVLAEIGNIEFYDEPTGDKVLEPGIIEGTRRFRWNHRFIQLPPDVSINEDIIYALANDGFNNGFPIGLITDEPERKKQIENLGTLTEGEFSKIIRSESGEFRIYEIFRELPIYPPGTFQLRN